METSAPAVKSADDVREGVEVRRGPTGPGRAAVSASSSSSRSASATRSVSGTDARARSRRSSPREPADPREAGRGVAAGLPRVVQRVHEAGLLGVLAGQRAERQLGGLDAIRGGRRARSQLAGAAPRARRGPRRPAATAARSAAAPPPAPASGSATSRRALTRSRDLGRVEQAAEAHHLHRQVAAPAARPATASMSARRRTRTADVRRLRAEVGRGAPPRGDRVGHPVQLGGDVRQQRDPDVAAPPGPASRRSSPTPTRAGARAAARTRRSPAPAPPAGCGSW